MKITIKTDEELSLLKEGGRRLAEICQKLVESAKKGVNTKDIDAMAEELILRAGGRPSFKGYNASDDIPYPSTICTSINNKIVHAIPSSKDILKEGDIIAIDIGMWWPIKKSVYRRPLCTDMAVTFGIGKISHEAERLISSTKKSLDVAIAAVRDGASVGDIGFAVQNFLKQERIGLVKMFAGHGVGYEVHEDPLIPNFGKKGYGPKLKKNMVIALEPITTLGNGEGIQENDGWTYKTADGSLAAHFEQTMAVRENRAEILTKL